MADLNVKATLQTLAKERSETDPEQSACLNLVAQNASGVSEDASEAHKFAIVDAVVGECAAGMSPQDFDGGSTWVNAVLKVTKVEVMRSRTVFHDFWDMILGE